MHAGLFIAFAAVSLPAFGIGYFMRQGQTIGRVSGVRPEDLADPRGFARFFGTMMYGVGAIALATGIALAFARAELQMPISIAFIVATNLLVLAIIVGSRRYMRKPRER
jgi:hypothetical protein